MESGTRDPTTAGLSTLKAEETGIQAEAKKVEEEAKKEFERVLREHLEQVAKDAKGQEKNACHSGGAFSPRSHDGVRLHEGRKQGRSHRYQGGVQ